jgi:8-oxo-dGTP pyrophosphatase MutT (NUDIX family)
VVTATQPSADPAQVPDWLATLASSLLDDERLEQAVSIRPGVGGRKAAVLLLIGQGSDGPEILFLERASTMRTHAGQIALPGGAADPGDESLIDTALREASEETGVDRGGVVVLGSLPPVHVAVSGFDVTAVVAWWRTPSPVAVMDPLEASALHTVPVAELVDPERRVQVRHPSGYTGPAFQVRDLLIWGLTAYLVDAVLELAGWQRPWDRARTASIPDRFMTDRRRTDGQRRAIGGLDARDTGGHDAH